MVTLKKKYYVEYSKGGWRVKGPETDLGPFINQFKAEILAKELNEMQRLPKD